MTKTKALYGCLCALAVVLGLFPSFYLNVRPWWGHDRGLAIVQLIFTLIAAGIPLFIFRLHWGERIFFGLLLLVALRVSVANGIESITLTRAEITSGRENTLNTKSEWITRIESWTTESNGLKAKFIPVSGETEYVPTSRDLVDTKREGRDSACEKSRTSNDCKLAQTRLEQVTQNFELTLRIDALERDIREAKSKMDLTVAPPDYLGKAKNALGGMWFDPLQDREMWTAYMAEGAAAGAPKLFVYIVSLLFAAALGENWWRTPQFVRESLHAPLESPAQEQRTEPPSKPRKPFGLAYVPGFKAWIAIARPTSGGPRKRYTPGKAYPYYKDFCQEKGFEPCKHPTTFGSLMKAYSEMAPVVKTGGQSYYELNLGPKLALVKAGEA